jgi:hypothetical protein
LLRLDSMVSVRSSRKDLALTCFAGTASETAPSSFDAPIVESLSGSDLFSAVTSSSTAEGPGASVSGVTVTVFSATVSSSASEASDADETKDSPVTRLRVSAPSSASETLENGR